MGENALTQPASLGTEVPAGPPRSPWTLPANTSLWKGFAVFQLIHWPTTCCKTDALIITAATFHGLLETFRHESGSEMRAWLRNLHNVQSFRPEKNWLGLQRNHTEISKCNAHLKADVQERPQFSGCYLALLFTLWLCLFDSYILWMKESTLWTASAVSKYTPRSIHGIIACTVIGSGLLGPVPKPPESELWVSILTWSISWHSEVWEPPFWTNDIRQNRTDQNWTS